jgi:hypothetical protein
LAKILTLPWVGDKIPFELLLSCEGRKGARGWSLGAARGVEQGEARCGGAGADGREATGSRQHDRVVEVNPGHAGLTPGLIPRDSGLGWSGGWAGDGGPREQRLSG